MYSFVQDSFKWVQLEIRITPVAAMDQTEARFQQKYYLCPILWLPQEKIKLKLCARIPIVGHQCGHFEREERFDVQLRPTKAKTLSPL